MDGKRPGISSRRDSRGVTIVEMAIVLVVFGLLLSGILKGVELVNNAKVKKIAEGASSIRVAHDGFKRRYRAIPGDFRQAAAYLPGSLATGGRATASDFAFNGNGNGLVERYETGEGESTLAFHHLVRARFLNCPTCIGALGMEPAAHTTMTNIYGGLMSIYTSEGDFYEAYEAGRLDSYRKLIAHLGGNIPVGVLAEVDRKIDDGIPHTGMVRAALFDERGRGGTERNYDYECVRALNPGNPTPLRRRSNEIPADFSSLWYVQGDATNCAAALIL